MSKDNNSMYSISLDRFLVYAIAFINYDVYNKVHAMMSQHEVQPIEISIKGFILMIMNKQLTI